MRTTTLVRRLIMSFLIIASAHEVFSDDGSTASSVSEAMGSDDIVPSNSVSKVFSTATPKYMSILLKELTEKEKVKQTMTVTELSTTRIRTIASESFKTTPSKDGTQNFPSTNPSSTTTIRKTTSSASTSSSKEILSSAASTQSTYVLALTDELLLTTSSPLDSSTDSLSTTIPADNPNYVLATDVSPTASPASSSKENVSLPSKSKATTTANSSEGSLYSTNSSSNLVTRSSLTTLHKDNYTHISPSLSTTHYIQGSNQVLSSADSGPSSQTIVSKGTLTVPVSSSESSSTLFTTLSTKFSSKMSNSDDSSEYASKAHSQVTPRAPSSQPNAMPISLASTTSSPGSVTDRFVTTMLTGDPTSNSTTDTLQTKSSMQTPRKNSTSALNASTSPVVLSSSESFMSSSTTVSSTRTTDILTTMWQRDGPTNSSSRDTPSRSRSPEPSFASSDVSIVPMAMSTSKAVLSTFDAGETLPSTVYSTSLLSEEMTTVMPTSVPEDENDMCFPMRETTYPRDCAEIQTSCTERLLVNGEYVIQPEGYPYASFPVYCDFQTDDGNWTVIQRRIDGSINFERNWQDYKSGFGFLNTEFWLGNEKLHYLTSQTTYEILIELKNVHNDLFIAKYSKFRVGDEGVHYRLILGPYNGNAGNQLSKHANAHFSTPDADHDSSPNSNCADIHGGGWWFVQCDWCNLNGVYGLNENAGGIEWEGLPGGSYGLRATEMKIRPLH